MRSVFSSNSEAIHIFANDPYRSGRSQASISFGGGVLFSYNTAIAQHVTNEQGQAAIILNRTSYSVSTSKHQGQVGYAANHLKSIYVDFIPYNTQALTANRLDNKRLIERYEAKAAEFLVRASRARSKADDYRAAAFNTLNELKEYLAFFGIEYQAGDLSALEAAAADADRKAREAAKIRAAEKIKEQAEALEKWRAGEDMRHYFEVTALRINGDTIETTKGANIPLDHAIKIWPMLKRWHDSGEKYYRGQHSIHLGHYTVNSFADDILTVGCHKIPFTEVSAIAQQLHLN